MTKTQTNFVLFKNSNFNTQYLHVLIVKSKDS